MTQMSPPEEVLYAFSQWLQQWAEYAQVQAELFAGSANPPAPEGDQPPAHWLELVQSGPPAHWLALFEEYGLEPPHMDTPPGDMQTGIPTPGPAPRALQDWLGEFQRGLAQFTQQPVPLTSDLHPTGLANATGQPLIPDQPLSTPLCSDPYPAQKVQASLAVGSTNDAAQVSDLPLQKKVDEARPAPIRLHLNLQPPAAMPVPVPSQLQDTVVDPRPVPEQPPPATLHPVPRLTIGIPVAMSKPPLSVQPASPVEQIGESSQGDPASRRAFIADTENILPQLKPIEPDFSTQSDLDSVHSAIRQKEVPLPSSPNQTGQNEQTPPVWSQPAAAHWPELPERLPPIKPPSNVLAEPAHRKRIDHEQRGRSWNT